MTQIIEVLKCMKRKLHKQNNKTMDKWGAIFAN